MSRHILTSLIVLAFIYKTFAAAVPQQNKTITIPADVTYQEDSNNICTPASWTDFLSFYAGNYLIHAATVISFPGEPTNVKILNMVLAIFFPCIGAGRGLMAILRAAVFKKDPLQQALQSQALCMVVRSSEWKPEDGETLRSLSFFPRNLDVRKGYSSARQSITNLYLVLDFNRKMWGEYINKLKSYDGLFRLDVTDPPWMTWHSFSTNPFSSRIPAHYKVSGKYELPSGYELSYVPPNAIIKPVSFMEHDGSRHVKSKMIVSDYSLASSLVAIVQIFYALATLYQSRGDQITRYGYAAFGFTVIPYLFMSFVNLLGNIFTPTFPSLYLVHTEIMDEAIKRGGRFDDTVATLESAPLTVKDSFVFSGTFEGQQDGLWKLRVTSKVYNMGETEPLVEEPISPLVTPTPEDITQEPQSDPDSSHNTLADEKGTKYENILICPQCYNFKVSRTREMPRNCAGWKFEYLYHDWFSFFLVVINALPLAVIGGLSRFKAGESTLAQRAWIMSWLIVGMVAIVNPFWVDAALIGVRQFKSDVILRQRGIWKVFTTCALAFVIVLLWSLLIAPAIGRLIVVGQMLRDYGSCMSLSS